MSGQGQRRPVALRARAKGNRGEADGGFAHLAEVKDAAAPSRRM